MKILRIIARLNVGGPARHVVWLSEGLRSEGYETVLVSGVVPPGEDDMSYVASEAGVEPRVIPQMSREISLKDALTVWKLYRLMVREQPDLVHTHTAKAGTVGRVAGVMYRWLTPATLVGKPRACRFVHTYHGHVFHSYYGAAKTRLFLTIEKLLARLATHRIVVISEQQRREINEQFRVGRRSQFAVIPLGIDLEIYANWKDRRTAARQQFGAGEDERLIGIVGRLTEVKNHKLFLEAAALLKKTAGTRVRFVIIGDGNMRAGLERQAAALGLQNEVSFVGTRSDPENFYAALDIVALTSLNEGTPLSLIEAMANAKPVIATAVGGVVDLLGAEAGSPAEADFRICERGISVPTGDAGTFARGLKFLLDNERLRRELGERGRDFVIRNYDKQRLLADVNQLYAELLRGVKPAKAGTDSPGTTQDHYRARLTPRS
jgi:glycosyltransferase involved in cell wall biosynthesis